MSSCPYSAKSLFPPPPPPHGGHVFRRIKISRTTFEKGHPRNKSREIIFKIGPAVSEEKIFKEFLKKFHFVAMATRDFDGIKLF